MIFRFQGEIVGNLFCLKVPKSSNAEPVLFQTKNMFSSSELKSLMGAVGVEVGNFYDFMSNLSSQGYFIKKADGCYQLLSAEF